MKIAKVEVKIGHPDQLPAAAVSKGVDEMLDAGQADMIDVVFDGATHPEIDPADAKECVRLQIGDADVVDITNARREPI